MYRNEISMCSGAKRKPPAMKDGEEGKNHGRSFSELLEHAASDNLPAFESAADDAVNEPSLWYGRKIGSKTMSFEERTPAMIAAMYGSKTVLEHLISTRRVDVNLASASDGATALHCAAAGGSESAAEVVELLLNASADANAVDKSGKRAADLVARRWERNIRKEYPSLPDMKNGLYGTDEFRMYSFKVKPCSRAYSHDWTECPFVHPGENARRRDPRKFHYSCVPCPEFRKGACHSGDACEYAHGIFECWLHPAQYRTRLCKDDAACHRRVCFFAHRKEELRPLFASTGSAVPSPPLQSPTRQSYPLSSRAAAFANRSQSFVERFSSPTGNSFRWGSPDWGEHMKELRKSASFGLRGGGIGSYAAEEEPDVSWVQSLVLDTQPMNTLETFGTRFDDGASPEIIPAWLEQMYIEQEQIVA